MFCRRAPCKNIPSIFFKFLEAHESYMIFVHGLSCHKETYCYWGVCRSLTHHFECRENSLPLFLFYLFLHLSLSLLQFQPFEPSLCLLSPYHLSCIAVSRPCVLSEYCPINRASSLKRESFKQDKPQANQRSQG